MGFKTSEFSPSLLTFGRKGASVDLSAADQTMGETVKAIVVATAGSVVYSARHSPDVFLTLSDLPAGYVIPHIPGVIRKTGTTASLITVED